MSGIINESQRRKVHSKVLIKIYMRSPSFYYVAVTLLDWTLSCFAAPRPCPSLIQITCVIFTDDLWRKKIKKTNCVGGCQCGLWYCVLVKPDFSPHTSPVSKVSLFQGLVFWCVQTLQKCDAALRQPAFIFLKCQVKLFMILHCKIIW